MQTSKRLILVLIGLTLPIYASSSLCPKAPELGQIFLVKIPYASSRDGIASYTRRLAPTLKNLKDLKVSGLLLFGGNLRPVRSAAAMAGLTNALTKSIGPDMFVAVDQEGGRVQRLRPKQGLSRIPSARAVGEYFQRSRSLSEIRKLGQLMGKELRAVGVNWNFAPVADVGTNPDNPVIAKLARAFSADPKVTGDLVTEVAKGHAHSGVIATIKHFPGHGDTARDSHYDFVQVRKTKEQLYETELIPFRAALANGVDSVMIGHIALPLLTSAGGIAHSDPRLPATLSPAIVNGLLRNELGYQGVVVSDDLQMRAISRFYSLKESVLRGLAAGIDVFLISSTSVKSVYEYVCSQVSEKPERMDQLKLALKRVRQLKSKYKGSLSFPIPVPGIVSTSVHREFLSRFSSKSVPYMDPHEQKHPLLVK